MPRTTWNPAEVLTVGQDTDYDLPRNRECLPKITRVSATKAFSCVGWAPSKDRECHNPISKPNRQTAAKIIAEMGRCDVLSTDFEESLEELAECLLCRGPRHYISQQESVVEMWKGDIRRYRRRMRESTQSSSSSSSRRQRQDSTHTRQSRTSESSTVTPTPGLVETLESFTRELAELNRYHAGTLSTTALNEERPRSIPSLPLAAIMQAVISAPAVSERASAAETHAPGGSTLAPTQPSAARIITAPEISLPETAEILQDVVDASSVEPSLPAPSLTAPTTIETSGHEDDTQSAAHHHPSNSTRRPIEGECCICCQDLSPNATGNNTTTNSEDDLTWCQAQCGQNFHANCVAIWLETQDGDGREKKCPYWYVPSIP